MLLRCLKILKLTDLYKLKVAQIMFRHISNNFPSTFLNLFTKITHVHSRSTRLATKKYSLQIPKFKTAKLQRSFNYQGVKIWNSIPEQVQNLSFCKLKKNYKKLYWLNYIYIDSILKKLWKILLQIDYMWLMVT